jgi:hypothetical protein
MATHTEHCGQVYQRNVPAIFLQYGSPKCIAVSSAATFGLETIKFSIPTASAAKVEIEAVHQPPLDESLTNKALYEFSKKILTEKEVMAVTYETEKGIIRIWTFIEKRDKKVRRSIYTQELNLMETFPNLIFDFNVVSLERSKTKPFIPIDLQGHLIFYRG